jgi:hypothetical protein
MLSQPLSDVLRSGRADFNAQFAQAKRQLPELDAQAFAAFLHTTVDAWVTATSSVRPDRVPAVVLAAYEIGLELCGLGLAGPTARSPELELGLRKLLPALASTVAEDPLAALTAIANALHQLGSTPTARRDEWVDRMLELGPRSTSVGELLRVGQVLAWRSGLAHYRYGALAVAATLPEPLALASVGAPANARFSDVSTELGRDPWLVPGAPAAETRVVHVVGAFRGLSGSFARPPRLAWSGNELLCLSHGEAWVLAADAFGATFHRAGDDEIARARPQTALPSDIGLGDGFVTHRGKRFDLPIPGKIVSTIATERTLGLTTSLSHAVVLFALGSTA